MNREQIVELMARASWEHDWGRDDSWADQHASEVKAYLADAEAVYAALEAAGLEIVPRGLKTDAPLGIKESLGQLQP